MSMVEIQSEFLYHLALLIQYIRRSGVIVTGGELWRTEEQQALYVERGLSKIENSLHLSRLAVDLNFFKPTENGDFQILRRKTQLQEIGEFWEGLHIDNHWGGNWTTFLDCGHFERHPRTRSSSIEA
jgi:hypothetical protein